MIAKDNKQYHLPLPREHGAWVMFYGSFFAGVIAASAWKPGPGGLLLAAMTFAFLAQEPARVLLRGRDNGGARAWLAAHLMAMAACGGALVLLYRLSDLWTVAVAGAALFGTQAILLRTPVQAPASGGRTVTKRRDRTVAGELLAVPALTLPAAAAVITLTGHLNALAVWIWAACTLFFASGIVSVKLILASAKHRKEWSPAVRSLLGRDHCAYHAVLILVVTPAAIWLGGYAGWLLAAAFLPAILRAGRVWLKLDGVLPPLKRVGMAETALALLFIAMAGTALRAAAVLHPPFAGQ